MNSIQHSLVRVSGASLVAALAVSLSGCGYFFGQDGVFRDRGDDYLKAQPTAPIKIPEGSQGERLGQLYVIPKIQDANVPLPAEFKVPRPVSSDRVTEQRNQVKIQKLGDRRWIDINKPAGEVWPGAIAFLNERGMTLADENPSLGVLETRWISVQDQAGGGSASARERYRIQLESGLRSNTTEIHVVQMAATNTASERAEWPQQSMNIERETWFVKELAAFLARDNASQASMVAQAIGSKDNRVRMVDYPEPTLTIAVDYSRAWASVGGSLNRDGFQIDNSNRDLGHWQVSYSPVVASAEDDEGDSEDKNSVFARMAKIVDFSSKPDPDAIKNYRVILQKKSDALVAVTIRDSNGQPLPQLDADRLLRRIRANLL